MSLTFSFTTGTRSVWCLEWCFSMEIVSWVVWVGDCELLRNFLAAILVFRAFRNIKKLPLKITHAAFHGAAILFISLGLAVEFISHYYHGEADLYSLHSWVGMATIVIFCSQFLFGLLCYLSTAVNERFKAFYLPIHVFFGTVCFVMAIATCLIGLNQNARFNMKYSELPSEGVLINIIGMLMLLYGGLVVFLVTKPTFRRQTQISKTSFNLEWFLIMSFEKFSTWNKARPSTATFSLIQKLFIYF